MIINLKCYKQKLITNELRKMANIPWPGVTELISEIVQERDKQEYINNKRIQHEKRTHKS